MIKFTLETQAAWGACAPQIKVNDHVYILPKGHHVFELSEQDTDNLVIDFFSKQETDTLTDPDGNILADTEFRLITIWCDGIRLENWFINSAVYLPRYFPGYLSRFPHAPLSIESPYQFNFPGTIEWHWSGEFWQWYFHEKNNREVINFLDKDPDRVWKFRGNMDDCVELVDKIKGLMDL